MSKAHPRSIAGGAGGATEAARLATLPRDATAMGPIARLLEDERVLGSLLLVPTLILLALFIAYLDDFKLMMLVTFAVLPLLLLMRRGGKHGGEKPHMAMD